MRYEHGADQRRQPRLRARAGRCSTAAPTRRPPPPSSPTRPASPPARTRSPTRASTRTSPTRTTRRAAPCAASAPSRWRSRTRRRWTSSRAALGMDPVELRIKNAMQPGSLMPTGQVVPFPAPVAELLEQLRAMPLPPRAPRRRATSASCPAASSNTTDGEGVVRGVGYADRLQERRLLRGLRRLLDRPRAARPRRDGGPHRRGPHRGGRGRPGRHHRAGADRHAPSSASSASSSSTPTRGSARPARARPRARPTSPAARSRPPARRCASAGQAHGELRARRVHRGDRRVAPQADVQARRERPGRRALPVRVLRAPRGGRRRRRARVSSASSSWPRPRRSARR